LLAILFFGTTTAQAAYSQIAKQAGIDQKKFEVIVKKIVKVGSVTGDYHAVNKKSGAYGRYQIMPQTARLYTKNLGIPYSQWKQPRNQDRIFQAILKDNIQALKSNNIKISAFTIYGAHQQGSGGFNVIMKKQEAYQACGTKYSKQPSENTEKHRPFKTRNGMEGLLGRKVCLSCELPASFHIFSRYGMHAVYTTPNFLNIY